MSKLVIVLCAFLFVSIVNAENSWPSIQRKIRTEFENKINELKAQSHNLSSKFDLDSYIKIVLGDAKKVIRHVIQFNEKMTINIKNGSEIFRINNINNGDVESIDITECINDWDQCMDNTTEIISRQFEPIIEDLTKLYQHRDDVDDATTYLNLKLNEIEESVVVGQGNTNLNPKTESAIDIKAAETLAEITYDNMLNFATTVNIRNYESEPIDQETPSEDDYEYEDSLKT